MISLNNLVVIMHGESNYYGLNIISSLLKNNYVPKAVLIEKRSRSSSGLLKELKDEMVKAYKKKGVRGVFDKFSRKTIHVMGRLHLMDEWASYKTYKIASSHLDYFEFGLELQSLTLEDRGIDVVYCDNNSEETISYINQNKIDVIIGAPKLLSRKTITRSNGRFINAHPAYLPYLRGASAEVWAMYYGLNLGATLHFIDPGIDTGKIIDRVVFPLEEFDTWGTLRLRGKDHCIGLYLKHLESLCSKKIDPAYLENQNLFIGKKSYGVTLKDYCYARKNLRKFQQLIRLRKSLGVPNPGMFYPIESFGQGR